MARWGSIEEPAADPILGLKALYAADQAENKIDLAVGAYRTAHGAPWVLPPVVEARRRLMGKALQHEYLPIEGLGAFRLAVESLLYGNATDVHRVTIQALSGTGAVRLALEFMARFYRRPLYLPKITWSNHWNIARDAGFTDAKAYSYLKADGLSLDFDAMYADIEAAEDGAIVLLHLCAHNPTGVDPSISQWRRLAELFSYKHMLPLFDSAYVGFASGDVDRDSAPFRLFVDRGLAPWACVSFSKNFGLYSERVGALHATVSNTNEAAAVLGHLKKVARAMYSNPPAFGARIVATVLDDPSLKASWLESLRVMSTRIADMRALLRRHLETLCPDRSWNHITDQIGMFSFTGIARPLVLQLRAEHHVYMLENGRVSMAGVNSANVVPLANAIAAVLKQAGSSV